jgi:hypothetical protein
LPASFASTFALSQAIAMAVFYGGTDADFLVERGDSWFDQLHEIVFDLQTRLFSMAPAGPGH